MVSQYKIFTRKITRQLMYINSATEKGMLQR